MPKKNPPSGHFYITTPIYYVNARPHLGHAYTTVVCDAIARRQRMLGVETYFLTGTDEHGLHVGRSAAAAGKSPKAWADEVSNEFRALWEKMKISNDDFIRTTDERHKRGVQHMFRLLRDKGFIYKGTYTGQYCVFDELYVPDAAPASPCPDCGRTTETISEENYYFKLSAFEDKLLRHIQQNPDFIRPESRKNEVVAFVRSGLRDLSISRSSFSWGVPVPDDPKHVIYVWLDALCNYITALGFGSEEHARFDRFWPADIHMVGKEIVRFHCVYWPAFLMAAELALPKSIVAHGWLLFEESKMSKSRGNIVRADTVIDVLGSDALRYFLMREVVFGQDGSFSFDALVQRYNSDLANDLGNLASRTLTMIGRYFRDEVPYPSANAGRTASDEAISTLAAEVVKQFQEEFAGLQFSRALETAWSLISGVNKYIVENEPWLLAEKQDESSRVRLATILYTSAEALRMVTALVYPVLPESASRIWAQLGLTDLEKFPVATLKWGQLPFGTKLGKIEGVFPRADQAHIERMQKMEQDREVAAGRGGSGTPGKETATGRAADAGKGLKASETANPTAAGATPAGTGARAGEAATQAAAGPAGDAAQGATNAKISIDDFSKIELRVAQVKTAEKVKGADKLLRLEVDLGTEVRQIVAGIAEAYTPESLIGRKVVIVANLAPRKLRGLESNGMIVAASVGEKGSPVLAGFLEDVPNGARLK